MKISSTLRNRCFSIVAIALPFFIWKVASLLVRNPFMLPSPERTIGTLVTLMNSKLFWPSIMQTLYRGLIGFFFSCVAGIFLGLVSGLSSAMERLLRPYLVIIRTTPIVSVIFLILMWFATGSVPIVVSFLVAFPIVYANVFEGVRAVDKKLIQMAKVYGVSSWNIITGIYIPSIVSHLMAGLSTAMGIGWKAVITAEAISQPGPAIGTSLADGKLYLQMDVLMAWTLVAIAISYAFESGLRSIEKALVRWR